MNLHRWKDIDFRGTIEKVEYMAVREDGKVWKKYALVYLPYGYDEAKPYNVLYLMHGGGGNADAWVDCSQIKNVFDQGFFEKKAEPFIAVFPTYYSVIPAEHPMTGIDAAWMDKQVHDWQKEFIEKLVPAVEGRYHTYVKDITPEGLKASRDHRAFGGFSMGGSTTWYNFLENLDYVSTFLPLSGDCWVMEPMGGRLQPEETVKRLIDAVEKRDMTKDDFRIFIGTGDKDIAYDNLVPQVEAMKAHPEYFEYSDDLSKGNFHFVVKENSVHAYEEVYHHVWHDLPYLWG